MTTPEPTEAEKVEMNVKLCEALGIDLEDDYWFCDRCDCQVSPQAVRYDETHDREGCGNFVRFVAHDLPNHFADSPAGLWACHEAEKTLKQGFGETNQIGRLLHHLNRICDAAKINPIFASAPQRAKALYLTLCRI